LILGFLVIVECFDLAGMRTFLHLEGTAALSSPASWVLGIAPFCFLFALLSAANALARIKDDAGFNASVVRALYEIGWSLMLGAFALIVVQPALVYLIGNGFTEMRGASFDFGIQNLTLLVIGALLVALAQRGKAMQSHLDEFV
jgi:hypothetical protein